MLVSTSLKVTFVTVFSCLALLLGLFTSAGIASAHSTHVLHSQTSTSQSAEQRRRCRRIFIVERTFNDFGFNDGFDNGGFDNGGFDNGGFFFPQDENFQFSDFGSNFFFDQNQFGFFNGEDQFEGQFFVRVHVILICRRHHEERFFDFQD